MGALIGIGALIDKNTFEGGAYSEGGAYWKEGAKSNPYGNNDLHQTWVNVMTQFTLHLECRWVPKFQTDPPSIHGGPCNRDH